MSDTNYLDPSVAEEAQDEFTNMTIAQARASAKLYNVALSREMTSDDIKAAIRQKIKKHNFVKVADTSSAPAPGRWRIIVHKSTAEGAKVGSRPVHIGVQGYKCDIPRNVAVDVPEKVVRVLETAMNYVTVEQDNGNSVFEPQLAYPFQVLAVTPGPDPAPGYEKIKARWYQARKKFRDHFGYWPKNQAMLREAIKEGHIVAPSIPPVGLEVKE
jgi:hypothetical protein